MLLKLRFFLRSYPHFSQILDVSWWLTHGEPILTPRCLLTSRSGAYGIFELCDVLLQVLAVLSWRCFQTHLLCVNDMKLYYDYIIIIL